MIATLGDIPMAFQFMACWSICSFRPFFPMGSCLGIVRQMIDKNVDPVIGRVSWFVLRKLRRLCALSCALILFWLNCDQVFEPVSKYCRLEDL